VQAYTRDLDRAHSNVLAVQSLVPDIQMAATRFSKLAEAERGGSLTGTSGSGTVVQLLTQMSTQLENLAKEVTASGERAKTFYEQGGKHLAKMRELVSSRGPINERSDAFGAEAMSLMGVIASLQQTSVAPAVKRAADGLASGFIAPAAGGRGDLADRQTSVVGKVESAVAAQSAALSAAADKILQEKRVEPERFQPLSTAEAVIRYAGDFLPSWAGAISIDLMPAVLVLIFCVVQANIRREGQPEAGAATMSAADILTALRLAREVENANVVVRAQPAAAIVTPDENVTALATARTRKE
jgi:phosphohistidine swiveling domain-containing protein